MRTQTIMLVASSAREFELIFCRTGPDVAGEARATVGISKMLPRRLRYQFFESVATTNALGRVAVAHTANDQG